MGKQKPRGIEADVQLWLLSVTQGQLSSLGLEARVANSSKHFPLSTSNTSVLLLSAALCSSVDFGCIASKLGMGVFCVLHKRECRAKCHRSITVVSSRLSHPFPSQSLADHNRVDSQRHCGE